VRTEAKNRTGAWTDRTNGQGVQGLDTSGQGLDGRMPGRATRTTERARRASRGWTSEEAWMGEVNGGSPGARRASADRARRLDEGLAGGIVREGEVAVGLTR
jgi:hypothetical protein